MPLFHQVGVLVNDLESAMKELSRGLDVHWCEVVERDVEGGRLRFTFSVEGPPHIELIEGPPDSPWDPRGRPGIDHIGYWTDDADAGKRRMQDAGLALEADGGTWAYHRGEESGARVELIDTSLRVGFFKRLRQARQNLPVVW